MTKTKGHSIAALLLTTAVMTAVSLGVYAQRDANEQLHMEQAQCFSINRSRLGNPADALGDFAAKVSKAQQEGNLIGISVVGAASPDGPYELNRRLSLERAEAVGRYLSAQTGIAADKIKVSSIAEDWDKFDKFINISLTPTECAKVRRVVDSTTDADLRERKLRSLDGGTIWRKLAKEVFPQLRCVTVEANMTDNSKLTLTVEDSAELPKPDLGEAPAPALKILSESVAETPTEVIEQTTVVESESAISTASEVSPYRWYLKTNLAAWAMLVANIQAEMDVVDHLSVMLPIYYSGWDYFKHTLKYRTFTVLPEVRYWLRGDNQGFFAGLHGGFSYYNVALDGDTRWQDRDGNTPAWGGGLTLGYRLPIRKTSPWQFEFSVGAGVYALDYDTFHNYRNGLLTGHHKKTFFGIDNFAVTLSYRFDQKRMRKGGER